MTSSMTVGIGSGFGPSSSPWPVDEEDGTVLALAFSLVAYWRTKRGLSYRSVARRLMFFFLGLSVAPRVLSTLVAIFVALVGSLAGPGTDLFQAAAAGEAALVQSLLVAAATERTTPDGMHDYVRSGRTVLFGQLASVSPLSAAVRSNSADSVSALLEAGADADAGSVHGPLGGIVSRSTPLFTASKSAMMMRRSAAGSSSEEDGDGERERADLDDDEAEEESIRIVSSLLEGGADPNGRSTVGGGLVASFPPLVLACSSPSTSTTVVRLLLEAGADPNARSTAGPAGSGSSVTALHQAVVRAAANRNGTESSGSSSKKHSDPIKTIRLLLRHGADPDAPGKDGPLGALSRTTPLFLAARGNLTDVVSILLDHGADPDRGYGNGPFGAFVRVTPLGVASQMGHEGVVEELLRGRVRRRSGGGGDGDGADGGTDGAAGGGGGGVLVAADRRRGVEMGPCLVLGGAGGRRMCLYEIAPFDAAIKGKFGGVARLLMKPGAGTAAHADRTTS